MTTATLTFGQLDSWESEGAGRASKEDYLNIKTDGTTVLRFLTEPPFKYFAHWVDLGTRKMKLNCAGRDCVLCKQGNEAIKFYVSIVLNRETGRCQVFEFKKQIFDGLHGFFNDKPDWGSLLEYDVKIDRKLSRKPEVYKLIPKPKAPLTKDEQTMIAEFKERVKLDKHCAPMTNEAIEKKLSDAANPGGGGGGFGGNQSYTPRMADTSTIVAAAATSADEDPDFSFA